MKGTPKRSEYLRKTSNLDKRLDTDIKLGSWYVGEVKKAVKNKKYGTAALASVSGSVGAGSRYLATKIANKRSRTRNK